MSTLAEEQSAGSSGTRPARATTLTAVVIALVLATLAGSIVLAHQQSRSRIQSNFRLRGEASAVFAAAFVSQQADRERAAGEQLLAGAHVSPRRLNFLATALGSHAAVLLDSSGRLLQAEPQEPALVGRRLSTRYAHLAAAVRGRVAVSGVVPSAVKRSPVVAVAVPFMTPHGRRVLSVSYATAGSALAALVNHVIAYPEHDVFLLDESGHLIAASPATTAGTLRAASPALAEQVARHRQGKVVIGGTATSFTSAAVPYTRWRFLIAVPDSRLYASVIGLTEFVPWIVFALVTFFAAALLVLLTRSQADRARLAALSEAMALSARTDSLTGLYNRRALTEHLTRVSAHARRHEEPLSVLMLDLDRFKQINDRFGHAAGDQVLCAIADCLRDVLRADDVYGRLGGDEFLVVMPDTDADEARIVAERIQDAAAASPLPEFDLASGLALSIGAATGVQTTPEEIVHEADVALYAAKSSRSGAPSKLTG